MIHKEYSIHRKKVFYEYVISLEMNSYYLMALDTSSSIFCVDILIQCNTIIIVSSKTRETGRRRILDNAIFLDCNHLPYYDIFFLLLIEVQNKT